MIAALGKYSAIFILGFLAHLFIFTPETFTPQDKPTSSTTLLELTASLNENLRLQDKIEQLTSASVSQDQTAVDQCPTPDELQQDIISMKENNKQLSLQLAQIKADEVSNWVNKVSNGIPNGINGHLTEKFEHETIDPDWAYDQEDKITTIFSNNENLNAVSVQATQCKSNQCKVSIYSDDDELTNTTIEQLSNALKSSDTISSDIIVGYNDDGSADLYISRQSGQLYKDPVLTY